MFVLSKLMISKNIDRFILSCVFLNHSIEYCFNIVASQDLFHTSISCRKLPAPFPQDRPCVEVSPPVRHPWVDGNMNVVNCPQINSVRSIFM